MYGNMRLTLASICVVSVDYSDNVTQQNWSDTINFPFLNISLPETGRHLLQKFQCLFLRSFLEVDRTKINCLQCVAVQTTPSTYTGTSLVAITPQHHPCTFWKSTNLDLFVSSRNLLLLAQTGFLQMFGWVYLNCCSTSLITVWQSRHRKVPLTSSGWTGWVRTTCPLMRSREPIFAEVSSRILVKTEIHKD